MRSIRIFIIYSIFTTSIFAFDGMSIGYDGSKFQSATFHNNQLIYGIDFLHANVSSEIENEYCQIARERLMKECNCNVEITPFSQDSSLTEAIASATASATAAATNDATDDAVPTAAPAAAPSPAAT